MNNPSIDFLNNIKQTIPHNWTVYPTLYKLNSSNKLLIWYLERDENKYRTISGHLEGNLTTSAWTVTVGKNIGKTNATSANDQAHKECLAKYENKLTKGSYVSDKKLIHAVTYIKPMLAETYYSETTDPETAVSKIKSNIPSIKDFKDGVVMQPKLDGIRCILTKEGAFSRKGDAIIGIPHIIKDTKQFFIDNPDVILDGEIYNHNLEFNTINGTVRRHPKEDSAGDKLIRASLNYFVYDIVNESLYIDRVDILNNYFALYNFSYLKNVCKLNIRVNNENQVDEIHNKLVSQDFEGGILRKLYSPYQQGKRSKNLLKVKQFQDKEYIIADIIEGEGNNAGMAAKIKIIDNDIEIYPNMTGSWDFCRKVLQEKNEYIGGEATIKFFGVTPDGSLRHPSVKTLYKIERDL
jgi:ATP-dependent DNA ligase